MAMFMLSVHSVEGEPPPDMSEEEMRQSWKEIQALNDAIKASGAWVFGGALDDPKAARVVRVTDGKVLATDGPFAETKEQLGGFYIVEVDDLEAAMAWASKTTAAVGKPIEVRPLRDGEGA